MKKLIYSLVFIYSSSAAAVNQGYYAQDSWPNEFPVGVELVEDLTVEGRLIPDRYTFESEYCTLKENTVFHPLLDSNKTSYLSVAEVTTYQLLEDYQELDMSFDMGTILYRLGFTEEGQCIYQEENMRVTFEMSCFATLPENLVPNLQVLNPGEEVFHWFQATCEEGHKAWFELHEFLEKAGRSATEIQLSSSKPLF